MHTNLIYKWLRSKSTPCEEPLSCKVASLCVLAELASREVGQVSLLVSGLPLVLFFFPLVCLAEKLASTCVLPELAAWEVSVLVSVLVSK